MKTNPSILGVLAAALLVSGAKAEDLYIAQIAQGTDNGVNAANAHSLAWLNTGSNWGAGTNKISPGDTVHLVGTLTSPVSVLASGTAGNSITILFEPGAMISMPSIPSSGAIRLGSCNYITIDGGQNGIIQNTANGSGMGQVSSYGIYGTPNIGNVTVQKLTIQNLYVRTNNADNVSPIGIYLYGVMSNVSVLNCSVSWCHQGVALLYGVGNSYNFQVISNHFNYINHGTIFGSGNNGGAILTGAVWAYNQADHFGEWDQPSGNAYHHNGFYAWADHTGAMITNIYITNNIVGGHYGNASYGTSGIYLSASPGIGVFNLLLANNAVSFTSGGANDGTLYLFNVKNSLIANNTLYDASSTYNGVRCDPTCTGVTFSNNIFAGFNLNFYLVPGSTTKPAYSDYNLYYGGQFRVDSAYYSLSSWQGMGYDAHSKSSSPLLAAPATGNFTIASNSPAIGAGVNLSALFGGDLAGNTRPVTGAWDIGAYQYQTSASSTNPVISVSPYAINFGPVMVNTSVTNTFTVSNIDGGTLIGTATIAAPFNIVSGGTYNLSNNQGQTVSVSFNPTAAGSTSQAVAFTGGGASIAVSGSAVASGSPTVSAISANTTNVSPLSIYAGTSVALSAVATNALTWQWSYTVNSGSSLVFQSGSGLVSNATMNYDTNTIGNTYVWTLIVSNGQQSAQSQFTLNVLASPAAAATAGLTFAAASGIITTPFVVGSSVVRGVTNSYIYQPVQTTVVSNAGSATFNFTITNAGKYAIQALVNAPTSGANSFYVNMDAQPQDPAMIWDVPITSGFEQRLVSWRGTGTDSTNQFVPVYFNLTVGPHQIIFCGREPNTLLSSFSILQAPQPPSGLRFQ